MKETFLFFQPGWMIHTRQVKTNFVTKYFSLMLSAPRQHVVFRCSSAGA